MLTPSSEPALTAAGFSGSSGPSPNTLSPPHLVLSDAAEPGWNAEWQQVFNTNLWRLEMMLQHDQEHDSYLVPAAVARSSWRPCSRKASPLSCHCRLPRSISYCQCRHMLQVTLLRAVFPHHVIGKSVGRGVGLISRARKANILSFYSVVFYVLCWCTVTWKTFSNFLFL